MMVDQIVLVGNYSARTEKFEQIFGIVPAMPDPLAAKDLPAIDIDSLNVAETRTIDILDFTRQFRGNALIGIEPEHPLAVEREIVKRPVPLTRVRFERVAPYFRIQRFRDFYRSVRAARIDDEDFQCPAAHTAETGFQVPGLVEGQNDYRDRAAL